MSAADGDNHDVDSRFGARLRRGFTMLRDDFGVSDDDFEILDEYE